MSSVHFSATEELPTTMPSIGLDRLATSVRALDPGSRALLDLSVRRQIGDDAMAPLLRTDALQLAWRRARALERVASELGAEDPASLAQVRAALIELPADVWAVRPQLMPPGSSPGQPRSSTALVVQRESRALVLVGDNDESKNGRGRRVVAAGRLLRRGRRTEETGRAPIRSAFAAVTGRASRLLRLGR